MFDIRINLHDSHYPIFLDTWLDEQLCGSAKDAFAEWCHHKYLCVREHLLLSGIGEEDVGAQDVDASCVRDIYSYI